MPFNVKRDHPGLLLFDVTEQQTARARLWLAKLKSIAERSVVQIDWPRVCVCVCVSAQKHAGKAASYLPE